MTLPRDGSRWRVPCMPRRTGHGGPIKVLADVASIGIGKSTLRKYLEQAASVTHIYTLQFLCISVLYMVIGDNYQAVVWFVEVLVSRINE